ncbi:MAG: phospholipase domain-containing protein, partial [Solimonas sp.]
GSLAGASTVDDASERHSDGQVYGPGPRVPMYVVSPWSRGGWVNSQVFDHTSIIRFLEERFGVMEPNISAWRRAVCGNLMSAFNFDDPNNEALPSLPSQTKAEADALRSAQEQLDAVPIPTGSAGTLPKQASGTRPSRALPYELHVGAATDATRGAVRLSFANSGAAGAVFHVYDRLHLGRIPRRYTVEAGKTLSDDWSAGLLDLYRYDLWVLGPNGFHRHLAGEVPALGGGDDAQPECEACYDVAGGDLQLKMSNRGSKAATFTVTPNAYRTDGPWTYTVQPGQTQETFWALRDSGRWYDLSVSADSNARFLRRYAGRIETGAHSVSDPAV